MEPGGRNVGVFGWVGGYEPLGLTSGGEAEAVERLGVGVVSRVEIDRLHGDAGPVARCNFDPVGKGKRGQSFASDGDCIATSVTGNVSRHCHLALTSFSGSQAGRLFDETVHEREALSGGLELAVLWSFELLAKWLNVFFVQAQIMQSVGSSLERDMWVRWAEM